MSDIFKGEVPRKTVIAPDMSQEDMAKCLQRDDLTDEEGSKPISTSDGRVAVSSTIDLSHGVGITGYIRSLFIW